MNHNVINSLNVVIHAQKSAMNAKIKYFLEIAIKNAEKWTLVIINAMIKHVNNHALLAKKNAILNAHILCVWWNVEILVLIALNFVIINASILNVQDYVIRFVIEIHVNILAKNNLNVIINVLDYVESHVLKYAEFKLANNTISILLIYFLEMSKMMSLDLFCYKIVVIVLKKRGYKNG